MENISDEQIGVLRSLIDDSVEILEEEAEDSVGMESAVDGAVVAGDSEGAGYASGEENAEEIECPECHEKFVLDMDGFSGGTINCPNCGAELELSFEKEEGD
jgi:DNA-directed RNA polymerase subunit RPC12/RpoP